MVAMAAALIFTGCKKDTPPPAPDPELSINPNKAAINFATLEPVAESFDVTTNQETWEVKVTPADATWLKAERKTDGSGFTVTAEENLEPDPRTEATVTVTAGEATPIVIKVNQLGLEPAFQVTAEDGEFGDISFGANDASVYSYEIFTNQQEWNVTASEEWVVIEKNIAANTFTVTTKLNPDQTAREATITVSSGYATDITFDAAQKEMEIFILAYEYETGSSGNADAVYYKNGNRNVMASGAGWFPGTMWVDGDDVHAVGRLGGAGASQAVYFKNNETPKDLTGQFGSSINSNASGIVMDSDNNIYISGYHGPYYVNTDDRVQTLYALCWKNEERTELSEHLASATTSAMIIDNDDIYILGRNDAERGYWKNQQWNAINTMPFADGDSWGGTTSIMVVDGKMYIGGFNTNMETYVYEAFYWVDGSTHRLNSMDGNDMIYGMDVDSEGNVYLAGATGGTGWGRKAMYTKNGEMFVLTQGDDQLNSVASKVKVWGDDVYVISCEFQSTDNRVHVGKLWKNGELIMEMGTGAGSVWPQDLFIR